MRLQYLGITRQPNDDLMFLQATAGTRKKFIRDLILLVGILSTVLAHIGEIDGKDMRR